MTIADGRHKKCGHTNCTVINVASRTARSLQMAARCDRRISNLISRRFFAGMGRLLRVCTTLVREIALMRVRDELPSSSGSFPITLPNCNVIVMNPWRTRGPDKLKFPSRTICLKARLMRVFLTDRNSLDDSVKKK